MGNLLVQPTLAGGELDPGLHGRVDHVRYGSSLATCRNWWVMPSGGLLNRPGTKFVGAAKYASKAVRMIGFTVGPDTAYALELGDGYMRFIYRGAYLMDGPDPLELVTPWNESQLFEVAFTQSVDVMTFTHDAVPTQDLRRLTGDTFELVPRTFVDGPFAPMNPSEARKMAFSVTQGEGTLTANFDAFAADMVGMLVYLEQKELREVKPWIPDERNIALGQVRRSDGKYYIVASVPSVTPPNYYLTGNVRPTHDYGRAFDGPQDTRTDGTNNYIVGVEWEYLHSGFGVVQITEYISPTSVRGVVTRRLPDAVVGGLAPPTTTWTFSGLPGTKTYAIAGAVSPSVRDYTVEINGVGVSPNPYLPPPNNGGQVPPNGDNLREP